MKLAAFFAAAVGALLVISGCASKAPTDTKSPVLESAERLAQRGTVAYAKGDLVGAAKDLQTAGHVYESLALANALANVQLSLARIDADEGRLVAAQARVLRVLNLGSTNEALAPSTLLLAQGRLAALSLQQKDLPTAGTALTAAERLCAGVCDAKSALLALRAAWHLASGDIAAARAKASAALGFASSAADKANARRSLAQIGFAEGAYPQAIQDAALALQLDQQLGASARVIADLDLLAKLYDKTDDALKASEYQALSQAAATARAQLGGK
jgi:tetratricopeptide (TPR) repeat protein